MYSCMSSKSCVITEGFPVLFVVVGFLSSKSSSGIYTQRTESFLAFYIHSISL